MRRTLLAVVGFSMTVLVLVGLKSGPVAQVLGWTAESGLGPYGLPEGDSGPAGPGPDSPAPGTVSSAPSAIPGATTVGPMGGPGPQASSTTTSTTSGAPPPPPPVTATVTGAAVAVRTAQSPSSKSRPCEECANYSIAVTVAVTDGRITGTSVAYSPSPGESQAYAGMANNRLRSSILTAQTWNLGRVSGATYSGNAWELSVKDAMSKAGLPV